MSQITNAQEQNARNMRDFLELYNKLTQQCFKQCVSNFFQKDLSNDESTCVNACAQQYTNFNQRLMFEFMEFQNAKQEATAREMEQAVAEGRTPNIPGLMGGVSATNPDAAPNT